MTQIQSSKTADSVETPIMTVWPTIGATAAGNLVGRLSGLRLGYGFFTLGKLFALATIPIALIVFCWQLLPLVCRRYALTNRRVLIQKGLSASDGPFVALDEFDEIAVVVLPGQEWLRAGEVIFQRGGTEVLRLSGVSRPEIFRQTCLKVKRSLLSVQQVRQQQENAAV